MNQQTKHLYAFGPFRFDPEERLLLRDGKPVALAPKVAETLSLLVHDAGHLVEKDDLIKGLWPDAFVEEGNLNKNIFVLRKTLGQWDGGREYIETVPKRGYRFVAPVNQSVEEDSAPQPPVEAKTPASSRWVQWLRTVKAMGILLLPVLAVFATWRIPWNRLAQSVPSDIPTIHSLAVLPLENLSGDPSQDYFADGMTDELITTLGQIRSLRVISRTSVMQYRGIHKTLLQIARELKVDAIVEGTVVRSGERVRITTQLIEASTDKHLWAQSYQADVRDVLGLQEEIATAIAQQIQIRLTPPQQIGMGSGRTINPDSYEWYLKGEYFLNRFTPNSTLKAAEYFQRAIEKDTNYAPAYCKLAGTYEILGNMGVIPNELAHLKAKPLIAKALELDPQSGAAHAVRGWSLLLKDLDFAAAGEDFKRAVELSPNQVEGHEGLGDYYATIGQMQQAVLEKERAREVDPVGLIVNWDLCRMLYFARRYDEALAQCKADVDLDTRSWRLFWQLGVVYAAKGMDSEAASAFLQAYVLEGASPGMIAAMKSEERDSGLRGQWAAFVRLRNRNINNGKGDPFDLAVALAYAGESDKALTWLERAFEARAYGITYIGVDPTFDRLRSDPRFVLLLRRIGLPAAQS
jgi:TolB-like protein/DNA-binding winged helix-turn-helix (wHTH) protein/Tfp pilus assembly protein PilF